MLYNALRTESYRSLLFYQLFMLRRLVLAAVVIFLSSVFYQLVVIILTNILSLLHLVYWRPFLQQHENVTTLILEVGFALAVFFVP